MPIITLLTDFGSDSPYVAAMKGVILSIEPHATLVDVTHAIPAQDVRQGAIVLGDVASWFPPETIHVTVVDPGVGTERPIVYARFGSQHCVAPDNGLLSRWASVSPPDRLVRIADSQYWRHPTSATFHGRDIMAPVAAHLAAGLDPTRLGPPQEKLVMLDWPQPRSFPDRIEGHVLMIDSFGNVITNITSSMLTQMPAGRSIRVACRGHQTTIHVRTYGQQPAGVLVSLVGSADRLELAQVQGNAAAATQAKVNDPVVVTWR
jgi:S-adenosylmethionine hydrolase